MDFADLQARWAEWLIDALIAAGVRSAVVSPGSRSTPLVLAIARADREGRLDSTVVLDERSAGFFALGQARVTGTPSLLVCTSGTAGTHYLPSIAEASQSRVPMIALTADRPVELRGRGAAQTIEQTRMFGGFVRGSIDLPAPVGDERAIDGLLRTAWLAFHRSTWPEPGPVHLNLGFRKPLEPARVADRELEAFGAYVTEHLATRFPAPSRPMALVDSAGLDEAARRIDSAERGVLLLGPCGLHEAPSSDAVRRFCEATGFPLIAEATSQHRFGATSAPTVCDSFEPLFGSPTFRAMLAPDLVVHVGSAPVGRALGSWLAESGVERIVVAAHGLGEAYNQAAQMMVGSPDATLKGLTDRLSGGPSIDREWARSVAEASEEATRVVDEHLAGAAQGTLAQGAAVRAAVHAVPRDGLLMVGNSMPVRDVDIYCPGGQQGIGVLSQRGVSGIDGLVSGAIGSAVASSRPTLLLLGDVSFQHDVGGLGLCGVAHKAGVPVAIVVVQNGGGRLFELLPAHGLMESEGAFERFYLTPPGLEIEAVAAAFGVPAVRAADAASLSTSLAAALQAPGVTVIEAMVDGASCASSIPAIQQAVEAKLVT